MGIYVSSLLSNDLWGSAGVVGMDRVKRGGGEQRQQQDRERRKSYENKSVNADVADLPWKQHYSEGGGVCVCYQAKMEFIRISGD